jgi:hypothetical protein
MIDSLMSFDDTFTDLIIFLDNGLRFSHEGSWQRICSARTGVCVDIPKSFQRMIDSLMSFDDSLEYLMSRL